MPLTPQQFKAPSGELEEEWFPLGDIDDRLTAFITEATAKVTDLDDDDQDLAAEGWVYYRAYKAIRMRLSSEAAKLTMDSGKTAREIAKHQIEQFQSEERRWRGVYDRYAVTQSVCVR